LRNVYRRAFIFHMLNDLGEGLTPIDFKFLMSRMKVIMVTFLKQCKHGFPFIIVRADIKLLSIVW